MTFSGATKQCTSFSIVDDDIAVEGSETFIVVIKPPYGVQTGSIDKAEIIILDNDGKYFFICVLATHIELHYALDICRIRYSVNNKKGGGERRR